MNKSISLNNLLLDVSNFRIVAQDSQKEARDAIIAGQKRKLVKLAEDILEHGLNPIDVILVIETEDGNGNYTVLEGNRRLIALKVLANPELAAGTPVYASFKKLNATNSDAIPKVVNCYVAPTREAAMVWIERKHSNGLAGAGTEPWSSISKARFDAQKGLPTPSLDAINYVLAGSTLDDGLRKQLEGSEFSLTTLDRLIKARDVQKAIGFQLKDGKLISDQDQERMRTVLTNLMRIIASGEHDGLKFTERNVDTEEHRQEFLARFLPTCPVRKSAPSSWNISAAPKTVEKQKRAKSSKVTLSTQEQQNLIPKGFKLQLPAGKINDIFLDLKELDVTKRRYAVSVLFRVFLEFTLEDYLKRHQVELLADDKGKPKDRLIDKLKGAMDHAAKSGFISDKELKPIRVAISNKESILSTETLNAYVHSRWMNPDPMELKIAWTNYQLFIERLWISGVTGMANS